MFSSPWCQNYIEYITQQPRWVAMDQQPPLTSRGAPHLNVGDLVTWNTSIAHVLTQVVGTVLEVRWCLADWMILDEKEIDYFPEAVVMWNDGATTNTSQNCLTKNEETTMSKEKKVPREFDDQEGRIQSPASREKQKEKEKKK